MSSADSRLLDAAQTLVTLQQTSGSQKYETLLNASMNEHTYFFVVPTNTD
jgi:hypothetical protein